MTKKNFISLILGTIGGILFAVGMCMCLLPEWNAFTPGVVIAAAGIAVLAVLLIVRRKMDGRPAIKVNGRTVGTIVFGVIAALVLGVGMSMAMVWEMMISGIIVGIVGIVLLLCLIPMCKGIK